MTLIHYSVERFSGHSDTLAGKLELFGIKVHRYPGHRPCVQYRADDGSLVLDVGEVVAIDSGPRAGQVHVWPYTDASEDARVILLRTAERVVQGDLGHDWQERTTPNGVMTRRSVISLVLDDGAGNGVDAAVTCMPEGAWIQTARAEHPEDVLT